MDYSVENFVMCNYKNFLIKTVSVTTIIADCMEIIFDRAKDKANRVKHGVSLSLASAFEWNEAVVWEDVRQLYGEARMVTLGYIGQRLHVVVYVDRGGGRRIISLRKANRREVAFYAQT